MKVFRRRMGPLSAPVLTVFLLTLLPMPTLGEELPAMSVEGVPTNLGLAHRMAMEVSAQIVTDLQGFFPGQRVILREGLEAAGNPVLRISMAEALRQAGLLPVDPGAEASAILEYKILDLRIVYTGVDRRALGLRAEVERLGGCVVAARAVDPETGVELGVTQREVLVSDHFPKEKLDLINSRTYAFTSPELAERDWSKTLEPWVVGGLVVSLAWLFYSNQDSGD